MCLVFDFSYLTLKEVSAMKNIVIICLFCVLFIDVAHAADEEWKKIHIPGEAAGIRCVSVCGKDVIVTNRKECHRSDYLQ